MAPIRIGILGLSASTYPGSIGAWANGAHLPHLLSSPNYTITALANSTKESAENTIKAFELPGDVKAYGTPEDLAADPNVDLVVVSVNVAKHKQLVWPALAAKKDAFVEWPLGANLQEAQEIAAFAKEQGVKDAVGLQGRLNPDILKIKSIIASGTIGKVLSTNLIVSASLYDGAKVSHGLKYTANKSVGGNLLTIHFGHIIDLLQFTLGKFVSVSALLHSGIPVIDTVDGDGNIIEKGVKKDSYDQILIHGALQSEAVASVHLRNGKPPPDGNAVRWNITGTEGQIELTAPALPHVSSPTVVTLTHKDGQKEVIKGEHEDDEVAKGDGTFLQGRAMNVARFYEAYRKGETERYASFEDAVELHAFLEKLEESNREGKRVVV